MPDKTTVARRPIRVGVSACLLGQTVRFDGGHKRDRYLTDTLGEYFQWAPVCPEVELGLGTPRETIQLVQLDSGVRLRTTRSEVDLTSRMRAYARRRVRDLLADDLSGYIVKRDSPSCGLQRVKIQQPGGPAKRAGVGLFTEALLERFPHLPVEEEGRLCDPRLRENWVERVFAYHALSELWKARWRIGDLVAFHTRYKFVLHSHSEREYRALGRLVAQAKSLPRRDIREQYEAIFMSALKRIATTKKHTNVLQHMLGFFKKDLDAVTRRELVGHIEEYRLGVTPLVVPMTLIRHYVRILDVAYLKDQVYLNPHPKQLALRNHV